MLVRRLSLPFRHGHDHEVHRFTPLVGPRDQVVETGLLPRLAQRDRERVVLTRIAMPADLEPRLLARVPPQEDSAGRWVDDQRRARDVKRHGAIPRRGAEQRPHAFDVARFVG